MTCQILSFVQLDDSSETAKSRLKADLSRLAPAFRIPNQIVALDKLPPNANGKIDLSQLQLLAAAFSGRSGSIDSAAGDDAMAINSNIRFERYLWPTASSHTVRRIGTFLRPAAIHLERPNACWN